jgi:hypothetical protein
MQAKGFELAAKPIEATILGQSGRLKAEKKLKREIFSQAHYFFSRTEFFSRA